MKYVIRCPYRGIVRTFDNQIELLDCIRPDRTSEDIYYILYRDGECGLVGLTRCDVFRVLPNCDKDARVMCEDIYRVDEGFLSKFSEERTFELLTDFENEYRDVMKVLYGSGSYHFEYQEKAMRGYLVRFKVRVVKGGREGDQSPITQTYYPKITLTRFIGLDKVVVRPSRSGWVLMNNNNNNNGENI